jgi:D-alanyl-D-alanine carboxypeptidase
MSKSHGKRILRWVPIIVLAVIVSVAGYYVFMANQSKNELADYIVKHPETSSIVAYTFDEQGEPLQDGQELFINADTPLVVASTMKVVVLAAYENAIVQGELNPDEQVAVSDVERYYLPKTDGNAHIQGLASLGIESDALGFASDQTVRISLDDIARIMIHYSGNAETDYLIDRLGMEAVNSIPGMENQTPIRPILGTALVLMNHENSSSTAESLQAIIDAVTKGDYRYVDRLTDSYLHNQDWRSAQLEYLRTGEYIRAANQLGWSGQVEASQLLPRGTAREYARLMAKTASGQLISAQVSSLIQEKLETIPSDQPLRLLFYKRYGSKDGVTAGVYNLASYSVPKMGSMTGRGHVVVILTNELPYEMWATQMQYLGIYLLPTDFERMLDIFSDLMGAR